MEIETASRHTSAPSDPSAQRLAFQKLGHGIGDVLLDSEVVNRQDAGVRQRRHCLRLALEARQRLRISRQMLGQDLDSDLAIQPHVARPVNGSHASAAEQLQDLVSAEPPRKPARAPDGRIGGSGVRLVSRTIHARSYTRLPANPVRSRPADPPLGTAVHVWTCLKRLL